MRNKMSEEEITIKEVINLKMEMIKIHKKVLP